jgi:hypothetical protein
LIVTEIKTPKTFADGYAQAVAQAASVLVLRKRGIDGRGSPVLMVVINGCLEKWKLGKVELWF